MEQSKVALKGKPGESFVNEQKHTKAAKNRHASNGMSGDGLNLIPDNSLVKYANDAFFVDHAKKIDEKFIEINPNL